MDRKKFIKVLCIDFLIALVCVWGFLLYFYILPRKDKDAGTVILDTREMEGEGFELPQQGREGTGPKNQERRSPEQTNTKRRGGPGNGNSNTRSIASDRDAEQPETAEKEETELYTISDGTMQVWVKKTRLGTGNNAITYYTADLYLTSIRQLRTAFALGSYGKNMRESTLEMAEDHQALLAVSGDSYGNSESGIVVRNGILYRSEVGDAEICILFYDGTMAVYEPEEFNRLGILERDVWQVWNFGPSLLEDGEIKEAFRTTAYLNKENPRCGIGYVAPGHYKFVVVDGRNAGYSKGASMTEFARIMKDEGCVLAYNLDGGKSSSMVWDGQYVNRPAGGGRDISDIIYIGKAGSDE